MLLRDRNAIFCQLMRVFALAITISLVSFGGFAQEASPDNQLASVKARATELVESLVHPSYDPALLTKNGNRRAELDRAIADSLVELRDSATPAIEEAFNAIPDPQGQFSPSFRWLLFAYAQIRGRAAYVRLRAMVDNPNLRSLRGDLDQSVALALGLTSYVSASRVAYEFICCRAEEPRHSLDRLILAWMQSNRSKVKEELGPDGQRSFASLLSQRSWVTLLTETWGNESHAGAGVGFRFDLSDDWAKPEETLDPVIHQRRHAVNLAAWPANPTISTVFVNGSGKLCAERNVIFLRTPRFPGAAIPVYKYVVDEGDMSGLLQTIATCARQ